MTMSSHLLKTRTVDIVLPQCPADFMVCCFLQDVVIAQKGMALIAAAANQVAAFPQVGNPMGRMQANLDSAVCLLYHVQMVME